MSAGQKSVSPRLVQDDMGDLFYLRRGNAPETRAEAEADAFMLLALIPLARFREMLDAPPDQLHPFDANLLVRRLKLYERIGE